MVALVPVVVLVVLIRSVVARDVVIARLKILELPLGLDLRKACL